MNGKKKPYNPDNPQPTPLGRRLREAREARGWSQEDFAERAGVGGATISMLESGKRGRGIGRDLVLKIAKAFNEPEDWWLDLTSHKRDADVIDYRPAFRDFVEADPYLTSEQKTALITTYIGFTSARRRRGRHSQPAE